MLNMPPELPTILPTAEGDAEERATDSSAHTYAYTIAPQRIGDVSKHRFLIPYDIGIWTNGFRGGALTPGLTIGQFVTYDVDQAPDFWQIVIDSETSATTVAVRVYLGTGVGGPFIRLGAHGNLKIPAQGQNAITLQNLGVGTAFGTVIAVKGFEPSELDYSA